MNLKTRKSDLRQELKRRSASENSLRNRMNELKDQLEWEGKRLSDTKQYAKAFMICIVVITAIKTIQIPCIRTDAIEVVRGIWRMILQVFRFGANMMVHLYQLFERYTSPWISFVASGIIILFTFIVLIILAIIMSPLVQKRISNIIKKYIWSSLTLIMVMIIVISTFSFSQEINIYFHENVFIFLFEQLISVVVIIVEENLLF